jgi:virginiamycin A acetyltransferase
MRVVRRRGDRQHPADRLDPVGIVSGEVPPYAIVGGNPARVLRRRYEPEIVDRLLAVAWWDWPPERLARHLDAIRGADIAALEAASAAP